jgi:hypothetical protein
LADELLVAVGISNNEVQRREENRGHADVLAMTLVRETERQRELPERNVWNLRQYNNVHTYNVIQQ